MLVPILTDFPLFVDIGAGGIIPAECKKSLDFPGIWPDDDSMNRFSTVFILLLIVGFPVLSAGEGASERIPVSRKELPVREVTLYTAGLAQIVHETEVVGDAVLDFPVEHQDLNDLLRSFRVEDLDGGTVESLNFSSDDPLSAVLADLRVNPSGSPPLFEFLKRTQGEEVSVTTPDGEFKGRVFSLDQWIDGQGYTRPALNLIDDEGIRKVDVGNLSSLRFTDTVLQGELVRALEEISRSRIKASRSIRIHLKGAGERRVRLSYIRPVPLWKSSYRIVVNENGKGRLEGWALVQNTGTHPWKEIRMSFVAGSPNAFSMDLATPLYVYREEVAPPSTASYGAVEYESGIPSSAPMSELMSSKCAQYAEDMYYEEEMAAEAWSGDDAAGYAPEPTVSRAAGERKGNYYRYTLDSPVTVDSRSSAMVPILVEEEAGETLAIFDPDQGNTVFKALRMENDSEAHWPAGPVSVTEGRGYGGDALLPDMIPGSRRFLVYAVHGALEVVRHVEPRPQRIASLRISGGVLFREDKMMRDTLYSISGKKGTDDLILIHHREPGWTLAESPELDEKTEDSYRFLLEDWDVEPVSVKEEYVISREYGLLNMSLSDCEWYLEQGDLTPSMKKAFNSMAALRRKIARIQDDQKEWERKLDRLENDQDRVRDNMGVLDRDSDLYKRYARQLDQQESEIQGLYDELERKESDLKKVRKELQDLVASLDAE